MKKPNVIGEYETIRKIIDTGASIARYGDGEFKLCKGRKQISQVPSEAIKKQLKEILRSNIPNLLVGIPNIWNEEKNKLSKRKEKFWKNYRDKKTLPFLDLEKQYYSSFISRADAALHIDCKEYWDMCKGMWFNRNVVLIKGEENSFDKNPSIFMGAKSVEAFLAPKTNAFESIKDILHRCSLYDRSTLFVISLGPTATILAANLCILGYQALDLGHFGMMYAKAHHYYTNGDHFWNVKKAANK